MACRRKCEHLNRGRQVDRASVKRLTRECTRRLHLARDEPQICLALPCHDLCVDRQPLTGGDQQPVAGADFRCSHRLRETSGAKTRCACGLHGSQRVGCRVSLPSESRVEIAADEQEEQEHDGSVEIGVGAARDGCVQAERQRHKERQGNRDIHIELPASDGRPRGLKECAPRKQGCRNGDKRRQPVKLGAGLRRQVRAEPQRFRHKHHASGRDARYGQGEQQTLFGARDGAVSLPGINRGCAIAEFDNGLDDNSWCETSRPFSAYTSDGEIQPRDLHAGKAHQRRFDLRDAPGAAGATNHEVERAPAFDLGHESRWILHHGGRRGRRKPARTA